MTSFKKKAIFPLTILLLFVNSFTAFASSNTDEFTFDKSLRTILGDVENEVINNGFRLAEKTYLSNYQCNAYTYEHLKTKAQLLYIATDDKEKFFSIGFKTPPENDSGATHVFEHTTLQGSEKYPVKSMLTIIGSSSMATFFNAVTSDDFTFYPFGSINEKDYYNLMKIYLDGIFNPMVLNNENVFKRDGIRIDIWDNQATYNGIVYNEMKNSSLNIDSLLYNTIKKSLYPDTYYKFTSGGTPIGITDLNYKDVLNLHAEAYHPSNSLTVLYGSQDLDKSLSLLDEYFNEYEYKEAIALDYQKPYKITEKYYSTYPSDNSSSNAIMSLNYVIPQSHSYKDILADFVVLDLLMLNDNSPLKKAVVESGITHSLGANSNFIQVNQGAISLYSMDIAPQYENVFIDVIENALQKVQKNGFEQQYIDAVFNAYKYSTHSSNICNSNVGYSACINAFSGWMYHNCPTLFMNSADIFEELKNELTNEKISDIINELFLNNSYKSLVILEPDKYYEQKQTQRIKEKLASYIKTLTAEEIEYLKNETISFYEWQATPDSNEAIQAVPSLSLDDISSDKININISNPIKIDEATLIHTYIDTKGISNILLNFDASSLSQSDLQYMKLWGMILGNSNTQNYTNEELSLKILDVFGELSVTTEVISNNGLLTPRFNISIKTLESNETTAIELLSELLTTNFDNKNLVKNILKQIKTNYESQLSELSIPLISYIAEAMNSEEGKLNDYINGYEFYIFVCKLYDNFDAEWDDTIIRFNQIKQTLINSNNLVIGYTNTKDKQEHFISIIKPFVSSLPEFEIQKQTYKLRNYGNKIAIVLPAMTFSVNQISGLKENNYNYKSNMNVLSNIISKGFLWGQIREQGGAYHTSLSISPKGLVRFTSFADPNPQRTMDIYKEVPLFIESIKDMEQTDLNKYIINAASDIDNFLQEYNLWNYGINNYLTGYDLNTLYERKAEILKTTPSQIYSYKTLFEKINENPKFIIAGNKNAILTQKNFFDVIIDFSQ